MIGEVAIVGAQDGTYMMHEHVYEVCMISHGQQVKECAMDVISVEQNTVKSGSSRNHSVNGFTSVFGQIRPIHAGTVSSTCPSKLSWKSRILVNTGKADQHHHGVSSSVYTLSQSFSQIWCRLVFLGATSQN